MMGFGPKISLKMVGVVAAVLCVCAGAMFTWWNVRWNDAKLRQDLLQLAVIMARTINPDHVQTLSGTPADLDRPSYLRLKQQLAAMQSANDRYRFVYLMGRAHDGRVFFFVDNEPISSEGYSGPGDLYGDASEQLTSIFAGGDAFVEGPLPDDWGVWVSALVPLVDPRTGKVLALFGLDVDARDWWWGVAARAGLPVGLMLALLVSLLMSVSLARSRAIARRREHQLAESRKKYRHLFESAQDGIVIIRGELIEFVNPAIAGILGFWIHEIEGRPFTDFICDEDRETVLQQRRLAFVEGEKNTNYEFRAVTCGGDLRWLHVTSRLIEWEGAPASLNFVRDTTDRRQAEIKSDKLQAQLLQAQKMEAVGRLAGGVAHDYNNMLSVIIGYAELALDKVAEDDPLHADLAEIITAANRSTDITRQLLAFARRQTVSPKVIDLNDTVEGVLRMLRRLIGEDIDLQWRPKGGLWATKIDPAQVDQILANLCVNARDAIGGVGKITIETDTVRLDGAYFADQPDLVSGEYVLLAVSDDGCGMDEKILSQIFEPFFTTKDVGQGTGLGLATVYGIVKQNNGFINVSSEPGAGTTFKIYLPRCAEASEPLPSVLKRKVDAGRGETILVVEDEAAVLKLARAILEGSGYRVLAAANADEALALADAQGGKINLLITDVIMPEINGRDLADRLQALHPELRVIFMSGYTADVIARRGMLHEGRHFIQKPFSHEKLARKVSEVLRVDVGLPPSFVN
jgi:two-component system sensor histidine kinase EvgS